MGDFDPTTFEVLAVDEFRRKGWDQSISDERLFSDLAILAMASHEGGDEEDDDCAST
jgi:hypothetical protein